MRIIFPYLQNITLSLSIFQFSLLSLLLLSLFDVYFLLPPNLLPLSLFCVYFLIIIIYFFHTSVYLVG
ncbi:hypothetical protein J3Q64DRAFT_1753820 [Phycomyces blakesleeanus]|uniref:Uncharacterized protein n=1 Tax=Phycomyces blakesleeanus TaxID=4837 RepID=A0ABR3AU35_PHYBL